MMIPLGKRGIGLGILLAIMLVAGFVWRDASRSWLIGSPYRFNLVAADQNGAVSFVSYDPQEKEVFSISYPKNLEIESRSVGKYRIGNLYKLGEYEGHPAAFVRRKVQGFMRVPVNGFVEVKGQDQDLRRAVTVSLAKQIFVGNNQDTLSRIDSAILYWRTRDYQWREGDLDSLTRAGVIEDKGETYAYNQERLKQYLGVRVLDWAIGTKNVTLAIYNESGETGLGADIAEFMSNLGFDVIAVKGTGTQKQEKTKIIYDANNADLPESVQLLESIFDWQNSSPGDTSQERAQLVITLGEDAVLAF